MLRVTLVSLWFFGGAGVSAAEPEVYTLAPPKEIADLLARLQSGEGKADIQKALAAHPRALPYLRAELTRAPVGPYKVALTETLADQAKLRFERNRARMKEADWAKQGRFDLLVTLLCSGPEDKAAVGIAGQLVRAHTLVMGQFGEFARLEGPLSPYLGRAFSQDLLTTHLSGASLTISGVMERNVISLFRAEKCRIETYERRGWILAVNGELEDDHSHWPKQATEWQSSTAVINGPAPLHGFNDLCLFVVDGDVELYPALSLSRTVVVANGNVRARRNVLNPLARGMICAAGNIDLPGCKVVGPGAYFHAGGRVTFADGVLPSEQTSQFQKELPFGVKFIDPKEFGVELSFSLPFRLGAVVNRVESKSVFDRYDIRANDIITSANGSSIASPAAFRRQLRNGVIDESLVLHIVREGKPITRIVYLDGVPLPEAPPPRPK